MATLTAEADVDADIFQAFTEKVTVVDVKHALVAAVQARAGGPLRQRPPDLPQPRSSRLRAS